MSTRSVLVGVLGCLVAGCTADTSWLDEPIDTGAWTRARRGEPLVDPAVMPEAIERPAGEPTTPERGDHPVVLPIDLAAVLQLTGSESIEIGIARSEAREAAQLAEAQQASALPFISPRLAYFRLDGVDQNNAGTFLNVTRQNASAGAAVDLVLQPSEAIYRSLAAARRASAASASYRASVDSTLLAAARTYFQLAANHARLAIAQDDKRAAEELVRIESLRLDAGAGLPAAVARARARVAEAEGQLQAARGAVAGDTADLVGLLNLRPGTQLAPVVADAVATIRLVDADESLDSMIARAHRNNPQLDAARSLIAAAEAEADMTRWGWLLPELRATGEFDGYGGSFGGLTGREVYWVGVEWKLDFGMPARHAANVQRREQAELRRAHVRNRLAATIARLRAQVQSSVARVGAASREVEAASENLSLVQSRHEQGVELLLEVLDAQSAVSRARTNLVMAVGEHNTAQYALLRAVGGPR